MYKTWTVDRHCLISCKAVAKIELALLAGVLRSHRASMVLPPTANRPIIAVVTDSFSPMANEGEAMMMADPTGRDGCPPLLASPALLNRPPPPCPACVVLSTGRFADAGGNTSRTQKQPGSSDALRSLPRASSFGALLGWMPRLMESCAVAKRRRKSKKSSDNNDDDDDVRWRCLV